nr:MAG TPA: hypothetical protein [Caudoviricetes sp.]
MLFLSFTSNIRLYAALFVSLERVYVLNTLQY